MPIIHIEGPKGSGKTDLGNSLRNAQISKGLGALLIDDTNDGEHRYLLEKIVAGASLGKIPGDGPVVCQPATDIPWKGWKAAVECEDPAGSTEAVREDPLIIFVGDKIKMLKDFELIAPGFTELFGPVRKMKVG